MPLFFFLLVLCSWTCSDNTPQVAINNDFSGNRIKIDTVVLEPIGFSSNLEHILDKCIKKEIESYLITKMDVESVQKNLNKTLKTSLFNTIKVVTAKHIKLDEVPHSAFIMEWHFITSKDAEDVHSTLNKLEGGRGLSFVPTQYKWILSGKKIYYFEYNPNANLSIIHNVYDYIIQINEK
jgi:hypothetical protein